MSGEFSVVLFFTTNHALRSETVLERQGLTCKLVPVPRHLSSDCGVCLRIAREDEEQARRLLDEARVEIDGIHGG